MALLDELEYRGRHATAKVSLAYLRKFFGWCAERDVISEVPTSRIRLNGLLKPRERTLGLDELRQVWHAADEIGGTGGALVQFLLLTGQRRHETSVMRWRDLSGLDSDNPVWSIPGEVTKNHRPHTVPLAPEPIAVIRLSGGLRHGMGFRPRRRLSPSWRAFPLGRFAMTDVIRISVKISGGPVKAFRGRFAQTLHCRNVEAQACSFVGWDDDGRIVNRVVLLPYGADERSAL